MKKIPERLLTVQEFADLMCCTLSCARRWVQERRVASIKVGRRLVRIPATEVNRLLIEGLRKALDTGRDGGADDPC